ncbi:ATP-grasp domain-containing protein [Clostridiaceae bacterium 35-E11]
MSYKIALIYDLTTKNMKDSIESYYADQQKKITKDTICKVLQKKYEIIEIAANEKIFEQLTAYQFDLVFNLSTGIRGESRQSQIPAILEMLGIPYVGSGILSHALALNKSMAKQVFIHNNIPTAAFQIFHTGEENLSSHLKFPLIVKPACEGSGFGVHKDSIVHTKDALKKKISHLLQTYQPPVLVEEFIEGREFTVGVIGNGKNKTILPIMEISFQNVPHKYGKFYTFELKTELGDFVEFYCPASIDTNLEQKIKTSVSKAFDVLECRDFARVDVRVTANQPYIIEINSLPGLKPGYSDLPKMALKAGISYENLIFMLTEAAIIRINGSPKHKKIRRDSDERKVV